MNAPFNATREACHAVSDVMQQFEARRTLASSDPLLALAYWIEAAGDRRIEGDVIAPSVLADMRDRARKAIERHTGKPFVNTLYPVRS
jgi:hypothetical protein